ncbi:ABC transporter ATP-binding protein/permease [Lachnospiraceae bacterium ZAX-1]
MRKLKKKNLQVQTIKKVLRYIKRHWILLVLSMVCAVITVILTLYIPVLTGRIIDCFIGPKNVDFPAVIQILFTMGFVIIGTSVSQWMMNVFHNRVTYQVVEEIRNDALSKLEILPLKYIDGHAHGEIISRIVADVDQFAEGLLMGFAQLFTGIVTIIGTLAFMFATNKSIACVVVIITPISLFVANYIAKRTFAMFQLQSEIRGEQTGLIEEMIDNQKVVQAFSQEEYVMGKFDEVNERLKSASTKAIFFSSITNPATRFVNSLVYTSVGIVGALFTIGGYLTVGQLTCFLSYANQYTKPFNEISGVMSELANALACADRILQLIEEEPQTEEAKDAISLKEAKGNVALDHVSFSYVPEQKLIHDLNLSINHGQRIAIVGPTGCGKTTIINLLMRFYDVDAGAIMVDGTNIKDITRKSLRGSFGMVLQETWLKAGTIRENLKMGNPAVSDEDMYRAAKAAHAHSYIKLLSKGYDTVLSEGAGNLSAGQKQLLCIARVMVAIPPMLILDEATSSIDTRTELKVQHAFAQMMKGRTSFVVAHRLSTILEADRILFMENGQILEQGSHEELLLKGGKYATLYYSQFAV